VVSWEKFEMDMLSKGNGLDYCLRRESTRASFNDPMRSLTKKSKVK